MAHTPGPWMDAERHESKIEIVAATPPYARIATAHIPLPASFEYKTMDANAKLIVAAPELLEALKELLQYPSGQYSESDGWDEAWKKAEEAIAKAE